jgi:hypothetical protein
MAIIICRGLLFLTWQVKIFIKNMPYCRFNLQRAVIYLTRSLNKNKIVCSGQGCPRGYYDVGQVLLIPFDGNERVINIQ